MRTTLTIGTPAEAALKALLKSLHIEIPSSEIREKITNHPFPSSLISISTSLSDWNIQNIVLHFKPYEYKRINDLSLPFISTLKNNDDTEQCIIVDDISKKDDKVQYRSANKIVSEGFEDFRKKWSGYALLAFPMETQVAGNNAVGRIHTPVKFREAVAVFTIILVISFSVWLYTNTYNVATLLLWLLKIAGLGISGILIAGEYDSTDSLLNKICTGIEKNCNKVLNSKDSKIIDNLSWSDLGFIYFAGTSLYLLLSSNTGSDLVFLAVLNLLCVVFSFYSLWYQAVKVKSWCYFCLATLAIFWLEFFTLKGYTLFLTPPVFVYKTFVAAFLSFSSVAVALYYLKNFLEKKQKLENAQAQFNSFKFNSETFKTLWANQRAINLSGNSALRIKGDADSKNNLTIVSNPLVVI